jgi:hypothetical protein
MDATIETAPAPEVVAAPAVVETPAAPSSMAAAFAAASERSSKAKATPAPAPAAPEPAKAAAPAAPAKAAPAPAAKAADPIDAAAAEIADPNHVPLPFDDIEDETPAAEETTTDERVGRRIELLKSEIKATWKPRVAELEETVKQKDARLAELEAFAKEREELVEKVKTYEAEMSVTKLEKHPQFVKEVTEPEAEVVASTLDIIERYGLNEKAIFAALEEPDKAKRNAALKAATSGLDVDQDDTYELRVLADKAQKVIARREELYKNADATLAELSARAEKETAAQAIARAEERGKATDLVVDRISKKLPFVADMVKGVADTVKETNFGELDVQKQAYNVMMGEAFPKLAVAHAKLQAQYDAALDEIASFTKASPRVDGGLSRSAGGVEPPRSLAEAANRAAGVR